MGGPKSLVKRGSVGRVRSFGGAPAPTSWAANGAMAAHGGRTVTPRLKLEAAKG
jgi:hypothetical protein